MAAACDLTQFLRSRGARESRAYMAVGVQTARQVLRRRKPFTSFDLAFRRLPGMTPKLAQHYAAEFLGTFSEPDRASARGPASIVQACPVLTARTKKLWKGY